jgi:hypothetical protein
VWNNGLDPAKIREAPEDIRGMLTDLTTNVTGFKGVLQSGLDWLSEKFSALADAVLEVASAVTGLPIIGFAHSLFDGAKTTLKTIVEDIKKGAKDALAAIEAAYTKISDFIAPYKEVISSLILAIAAPVMIPVILAGWAWRALPRCVKIPILNFILDIAIAALEAIPEVPTFGVLWPLLKPGVMAFMGTLRAAEDEVKEQVSNKIAKVISGASPEFLVGFVKGFCVGVWEGITDPFKAIWTVLEGLDTVTQYLLSLAGFGDEKKAEKETHEAVTPAPAAATAAAGGAEIRAPGGGGAAILSAGGRGEIRASSHGEASATSAAGGSGGSTGASRGEITARHAVSPAAPAPVIAAPAAHGTITATTHSAETPAPAAATEVEAKESEKPYVADPAAALASGAPMPESTRRLLEKLAAQKAAGEKKEAEKAEAEDGGAEAAPSSQVAPVDMPALKERAGAMAGEIGPDIQTVKGGFWDAVQEYFSSGDMSFDEMVDKLSEAWESAKEKIAEGATWLANQMITFFRGNGAEGELGDKIGWLTGTIAFQALLDAITAGTWVAAGPVLKGIAKFINWPMEFLGEAFKLLKTLGKYLLDGLKKLGGAIKDAAAGAFKAVSKALGHIAERLLRFGEEILGKFGSKAAKMESKAAGALGKEGTKVLEGKLEKEALGEAEQKAAQKLETQAGKAEPHPSEAKAEPTTEQPKPESTSAEPSAEQPKAGETKDVDQVPKQDAAQREASAAESGKLENDKLSAQQTRNETDRFRDRPESLEGTPPHRKSQNGKHEWREETLPNGECQFCRYSPTKICVATPELRAGELKKVDEDLLALQKRADEQAKAAAAAREKATATQPLSPEDQKYLDDSISDAEKRSAAAKKQLKTERTRATNAAKKGNAEEAAAARKRAEQLEDELRRAEEQAKSARELLEEQARVARQADEAEALAAASKKEAEEAAQTSAKLKDLEQDLAKAEDDLAKLRKEWPTTRLKDEATHRKMVQLEDQVARQKKALAEGIEASKGLTPAARDTLRAGTPFKGVGGAERERAFLESLPESAKGPDGTFIDYVTGEALPRSRLHPDHVVSVDRIFGMDGFGRLSRADQQAILDMPQNLRFLESGRNLSKQEKGLAEWLRSRTPGAPKLSPLQQKPLADIEKAAEDAIKDEIKKRLKKVAL